MAGDVEDCVRSHIAWMSLKADAGGGRRGREGDVAWAWVPVEGTMHLLFPDDPQASDLSAVTAIADGLGARSTALWSSTDRRRRLGRWGFEKGWQPWWMVVSPDDVPSPDSDRVTLSEHGASAVLAEAYDDGRLAGRAWLHVDGDVAGLYDMEISPAHRRRGLGRDTVTALVAEAASRGARTVTLNATPEGARLYRACGFRRVGEGRTWWRHAARGVPR